MLWVRSISSWAPTNIGPYCKANTFGRSEEAVTYLAGQIGLDPSTMQLVSKNGGWGSELIQSISNCKAVLNAVYDDRNDSFRVMRCVAYVSWKECGLIDDRCPSSEISTCIRAIRRNLFSESDLPISILPVPRLPRDAAIELELITSRISRCKYVSWKTDSIYFEGSFVRGRCIVASITFLKNDDVRGEEPYFTSLKLSEIIEENILRRANLSALQVCVNLQIYVVYTDKSIHSKIRDEIQQSFLKHKMRHIAISIIPVHSLSTTLEPLHILMESFQGEREKNV